MPARLDYKGKGKVVLASTPNGLEGAFWEAANMPERGYVVHHAPTSANPHLPPDEIAYLRSTLRPEIASQELDALFVDTGGATIFPLHALLFDGEPHRDDFQCDYLGLAIDSNSGKGRVCRGDLRVDPARGDAGLGSGCPRRSSGLGHPVVGARRGCAVAHQCAREDHDMVPSPETA